MLFDKPVYILFLVIVVAVYWRFSHRGQNLMLLGASYFFYGWWDWRFLALMVGSTVVDYAFAARIAAANVERERRFFLTLSLVMNFGFLGIFKYYNFFIDSFGNVAASLGLGHVPLSVLAIVLPPGISFYTFQAVAYIVDVYQGKLKPARSLVDYALFISLFPHLIAGPIQRPSHLLPQVETPRTADPKATFDGVMLIVTGLFRKIVIADNCALIANALFNGSFGPSSIFTLLLGTYAFAWQIYGDFSGYSDIARGSAQLLGFHFMVNFRQPYLATSLQDFWRRWHISLSTWLRDYLYIPLGGNRHGEKRTYANLLATMLLGGLWHGANWTFVVWGALHGCGLAVERMLFGRKQPEATPSLGKVWLSRFLIFHLVCLAWVFFRAATVGDAAALLAGATRFEWRPEYLPALAFLVIFATPMLLIDLRMERAGEEYPFELDIPRKGAVGADQAPKLSSIRIRIATAIVFIVAVAVYGASQPNAFIYFQF